MRTSTLSTAERVRACLPCVGVELDETSPLKMLGFDSIDTVDFLCAVHEEFGVRLTEAEFYPEQTIGGLINAIERMTSPFHAS